MDTLHTLKSTDPPLWLAPSANLSDTARKASEHLFSSLKPHVPKSPFDHLLVDGFDAEQIWQQIDLLSQPLLSNLRRQVNYFQKHPEVIRLVTHKEENEVLQEDKEPSGEKKREFDENEMDFDAEDDEEDEEGEKSVSEDGDSEDGDEELGEGKTGVEDKFLKINELEEYMEEDEAREYGLDTKKKGEKKKKKLSELDEDDEDEDEDEDEEDEDEDDEFDSEDADGENLDNTRYEDFFGSKKKMVSKRKSKELDGSDSDSGLGSGSGSGSEDEEDDEQDDKKMDKKENGLSTHEKQLQKLQSEIVQMEKANLEPKAWEMQGEATAASRPKNSALEVDLDFEHNVRPAPVITEEVTQSLEDMIKERIVEGRFDDIHKAPSLPATAPREVKEMDENKSKKSLAEVYEEEYVQKTNPAAAPLTFSDEQKEASLLFKQLCLKLDALSHFHFAPKPVIEDMSIQANVPALAMEEIAPMAVSDAAMLAPEEVFSGKGDIKEAAELTQEDRKRRRAKKKRKFKAESAKRTTNKPRADTALQNDNNGEE